MAKKQKSKGRNHFHAKVVLNGMKADDQIPKMSVYALDRSGNILESCNIIEDGQFEISKAVLAKAHRISIGPQVEDFKTMDKKILTTFRSHRFKQILEKDQVFEIARKIWGYWIYIKRCVTGSVKHCYLFPYLIDKYTARPVLESAAGHSISDLTQSLVTQLPSSNLTARSPYGKLFPIFCRKVCDGYIEVYRRTCCCWPWIIYDPRLPDLIRDLEDIVVEPPKIKWPPRPKPNPVPFQKYSFIKDGALDKKAANARQDLQALRTLSQVQVVDYINARPYLLCSCGTPKRVAGGYIQQDGKFQICWWEWKQLLLNNCHDEFAYKVKQNINGQTVTIYDGVAANQWFHYGDDAVLTSYHPRTLTCRENDFPGDGAFALLQDIGITGSWRLKTPNATGWDRVASPLYNDGLAYPAANAAAAKGKYEDRNWGGLLRLRYHFSEEMKSIGARYYRVSVVAADNNGNPTGIRTYLNPQQWKYFEMIQPDIFVRSISLGSNTVGGENNLYDIPYDSDRDWQSGQYHALLNTNEFANGRHLLTVEIFNSSGKLLRPTGTTNPNPNPGSSVQAAFTYRRWYQETGPTAEVPFAALTHMFWWDNREAQAEIVDFRVDGSVNTGQCQFLEGHPNAHFSVGYRAYHQEPMFMLNHSLRWRRGLGGPIDDLTDPHPNPNNVGVPISPPHQSGSDTFSNMLGGHKKCTFTISLQTKVKTFNGISILSGLDEWDQASVALEAESAVAIAP